MSHFIEKTLEIENQPVLKPINKTVVMPSISCVKRDSDMRMEGVGERKMVRMMFFHFKNEQYQRLHHENAIQMQKQFQQLKRKLALRAKKEYCCVNVSSLQRSMNDSGVKKRKMDLSEIIKMNPQKVDLVKKYRSKIKERLQIYRETSTITKAKENYQEWYDHDRNSPLKSPMYAKMTYLLEKLNPKSGAENDRGNSGHLLHDKSICNLTSLKSSGYTTPKAVRADFSLYD